MTEFILVDLYSQADAVSHFTQGWKSQEILNWMSQYGQIKDIPMSRNDKAFAFTSAAGIRTMFRFTEFDEIIILLDNTTYRPRPKI